MVRASFLLGTLAVSIILIGGHFALAAELKVEETADAIVVRSDAAPGWNMIVEKSRGDVRSLTVPAVGGSEIIHGHPWANAFGRSLGYHNFADEKSWEATNRKIAETVTLCKIVEQSPRRVVIAVVGFGHKDAEKRYQFRQHIIFEPAGARTDLEIVNIADDPWRCVQMFSPFWFAGGAVPDTNDPDIRIWDKQTPETRPEMKNTRTQDDPVPLPKPITHPFSVRIPLAKAGRTALTIREIAVPERIRERNEWSMPLGFGSRAGADAWSWWLTGGACPGAIKGNYDRQYHLAPAGEPQVFSWSFFVLPIGVGAPDDIPPHTPTLPQLPAAKADATVIHAAAVNGAPSAPFEWQTATPESQSMSSAKLHALRDALIGNKTDGLLVVRNDKIVCEWYGSQNSATKPHYAASMSKALVGGVATAVAISDGNIALDDLCAKYVPAWRDDPRKSKITVRQLGSHTSGLDDAEEGETPHDQLRGWKGEFWKASAPPNDPFTLARDKTPVVYEPGKGHGYSNPGIAMLGYCVTAVIQSGPDKDLRALLTNRVMRPIGVPDGEWSVGYKKTFSVDGLPLVCTWGGSSYTARAAARVGRLMLRGGNWDGKQVISSEAVLAVTRDAGTPGNGAIGWWSNNDGVCPTLPKDACWGIGAGHQVLLVVPSLDLIAVRNGNTMRGDWDGALYKDFLIPLAEAIEPK